MIKGAWRKRNERNGRDDEKDEMHERGTILSCQHTTKLSNDYNFSHHVYRHFIWNFLFPPISRVACSSLSCFVCGKKK